MSNEVWAEIYDRLAELIREHRTTLIFVNTRRMVERVTRHLARAPRRGARRRPPRQPLARSSGCDAEQRLKAGELPRWSRPRRWSWASTSATSTWCCQLGSPRSIATFLQRVGRAGHASGGVPKGRLFPLTPRRADRVRGAAATPSARGELDRCIIPRAAARHPGPADRRRGRAARRRGTRTSCFALVRRAWPYREPGARATSTQVRRACSPRASPRGAAGAGAYLHRDARQHRAARAPRRAPDRDHLAAARSPTTPTTRSCSSRRARSRHARRGLRGREPGRRHLPARQHLVSASCSVEAGRVRVEDAKGQPPTMPFWLGEAPARSDELSVAVSRAARGDRRSAARRSTRRERATAWLRGRAAAQPPRPRAQLVDYLAARQRGAGRRADAAATLVVERFFDEAGGMQLVLHAPFGSAHQPRLGPGAAQALLPHLQLRAAGRGHRGRHRAVARPTRTASRWRRCSRYLQPTHGARGAGAGACSTRRCSHALALERRPRRWPCPASRGGTKVPPPLQRMAAEDLLAVVFPDQLACRRTSRRARDPRPSAGAPDAARLPARGDGRRGAGDAACAASSGQIEMIARDSPSPRRWRTRSSTRGPTPSSTTRRWRSGARRRCSLAPLARSRDRRGLGALDAEAIAPRARRGLARRRDADELHDALLPSASSPRTRSRARAGSGCATPLAGARRRPSATLARRWAPLGRRRAAAAAPGAPSSVPLAPRSRPAAVSPAHGRRTRRCVELRARPAGRPGAGHRRRARRQPGPPAERVEIALAALETRVSCCAASSRPAPGERSGASAGCSRASIATPSDAAAPRSSRSRSRFHALPARLAAGRSRRAAAEGAGEPRRHGRPARGFRGAGGRLGRRDAARADEGVRPAWLDGLCLAGRWVWGRGTRPPRGGRRARCAPRRSRFSRAAARPLAGDRGAGRSRGAGAVGGSARRSTTCWGAGAPRSSTSSPTAAAPAHASRVRARRAGRRGPRQRGQLRRPARPARARPQAPARRPLGRRGAAMRCSASENAGRWSLLHRAGEPRVEAPSATPSRPPPGRCCAATAWCSAAAGARRRCSRPGVICCWSTAGSRRRARSAAAASWPASAASNTRCPRPSASSAPCASSRARGCWSP